jgi:hypothetical protein
VEEKSNIAIKSFIKSLILSLELESANAILKMELFASSTIEVDPIVYRPLIILYSLQS